MEKSNSDENMSDDEQQTPHSRKGNQFKVVPSGLEIKKLDNQAKKSQGPLPDHPFVMVVSGHRASGKTTLVLNLLVNPEMYGQTFDEIYLFVPTVYNDPKWSLLPLDEMRETGNIITQFDPGEFIRLARTFPRYNVARLPNGKKVKVKQRILFVFDDSITSFNYKTANPLKECLLQNRHKGISMIISTQNYNSLPTWARRNMNALVLFHTNNKTEIDAILRDNYSIADDLFLQLYHYAVGDESYKGFLLVNLDRPVKQRFFKNLDQIKFDITPKSMDH